MSVFAPVVSLLSYIVPFLFVLSVVVFFHELGHFLVGRWCGVKVDAFSLGFGPEIAHYTDRKGTRWRLALLPLGGYVRFHGDANGASMVDSETAAAMPRAERAVTFFAQPVWKRALIVAAGPIANFILAIVVLTGLFYFEGHRVMTPRVESVQAGEAADRAGFKAGDLIVSVNGEAVEGWSDLQRIVQSSVGEPLTIVVRRNDGLATLVATPVVREIDTIFGKNKVAMIGLNGSRDPADVKVLQPNPVEALRLGMRETWFGVDRTISFVTGVFAGRESTDQMSGPIGIARVSGEVARLGFSALINLIAILSVSIGLLNLVPIPLLDGGHLLYYAAEALRGRPLSQRVQEVGFRIGLAFVLALMILATRNDIVHLIWS